MRRLGFHVTSHLVRALAAVAVAGTLALSWPAAAAPRPSGGQFQAVPYLGLHAFGGGTSNGADPGLRLGAILGGRVSDSLSANGEMTIDVMNHAVPSASGGMAQMTFSPLFHAGSPATELVVGPRFGAWAMTSQRSTDGVDTAIEAQGWTIGANAGVSVPVGQGATSLGMLLSFANFLVANSCISMTGYGEMCPNRAARDFNVVSLTFAAML